MPLNAEGNGQRVAFDHVISWCHVGGLQWEREERKVAAEEPVGESEV